MEWVSVKVWVYARTSGEEKDTGQDVRAQAAAVAHMATDRGEVVGQSLDDGVTGDTDPTARTGFSAAMQAVSAGLADVVVIAEASRFSRQHPVLAMLAWEQVNGGGVPVVSLKEPHFNGLEQQDGDKEALLVRFITFWTSWGERITIKERTALAMKEIKEGRRKTKSGRPPGRPPKITEEEARQAWEWAQQSTPADAARRLSRLRGADAALDPRTKKKRSVTRTGLIEAWKRYNMCEEIPSLQENNNVNQTDDSGTGRPVIDTERGA
jgi:DNA invertase Pin-like site-specific DNA recombinase